jgi:iron complex transport system ATP-binding protein
MLMNPDETKIIWNLRRALAGLDQQQALELVDKLRREQGLTVVSAMHDLTLAGMYADRLVLMHQGARVAEGSAKEVLQPNILSEFYGVSARVHHEDDGTVVVIPQRISTR